MPGMYYYPGFYWDPTYILILIGALLSMWASSRVNATFAKYDRVRNLRGLTGAQAAEAILHQAGIYNVSAWRRSVWQPMNVVMPFRIRRIMRRCGSGQRLCLSAISEVRSVGR